VAKRYRPVGKGWEVVLHGAAEEREAFLAAAAERYLSDALGTVRRKGDTVAVDGEPLRTKVGLLKTYKTAVASWTTASAIGRHLSINWTLAIEDSPVAQVLAEQGKLVLDDPRLRAFARVALDVTQDVTQDFARRLEHPLAPEELEASGSLGDLE
jgi:hypothetical protein